MRTIQSRHLTKAAFLVTILFGIAFSAQTQAAERVFDKSFTVAPGGTLDVDTDVGAIDVSGSDTDSVSIHAVIHGNRDAVDDFDLTAESGPDGVSVRGRRSASSWFDLSWLFGGGLHVQYVVKVPRKYHLQLHTAGGDLKITDIDGRAIARTSGGNVTLTGINGQVQVRTSGGSIRGGQLIGDIDASTSGGDIRLTALRGPVDVRTSGGNVRLTDVDGQLTARTSGGNMHADLVGSNRGVTMRTSGGNIDVAVPKDFAANVHARTSGGTVFCDLPIANREDNHHRMDGAINGGGSDMTLRTSGGNIAIRERD